MTKTSRICIVFFVFIATSTSDDSPDYYWKDYTGTPPNDAYSFNNGSFDIYIGNVGINQGGLYVGELYSGSPNITVTGLPYDQSSLVHHANRFVKILCSRYPFRWLPTTSDVVNNIPNRVLGGWEFHGDYGELYIGRILVNGLWRIGKVVGYDSNKAYIYYPSGKQELHSTIYEILVYDN